MVKLKKQKVRPRGKKITLPHIFATRFKTTIKFLIVAILVGGIGIGLVRLKYMFVDSEYFMIKGADVKLYDENGTLRYLSLSEVTEEEIVGQNIFFIDLYALKEKIEIAHPEFKDIVVRRHLPNKLTVQGNLRKGIAQIRSDRYYLVDEEGVVLPDVKNFPDSDLPIISGLGINLAKVQTSKFSKFEKQKLDMALSIIKEMQAIKELSKYKLKLVDIADPGNVSFFFTQAKVEIKIGNSDFRNRLSLLATVLDRFDSDINKFKYIDLRFEDPIISPR